MTILGDACSLQNTLSMQTRVLKYYDYLKKTQNVDDVNQADLLKGLSLITQGYSINVQLGWAGAVVCGYFAAGGSSLSGGHLNMSVTISNFFFRGSPKWHLAIAYIVAQLLGGYVGGLLLFGYYRKVIEEVYPDWKTNTALISSFVTVPLDYLSPGRQFISEAVATMFLIMGIFAMTDPYNNTSNELFPLYLFMLIYTLMAAMSLQTEAALNFGRDMGPRLALYTVGASRKVLFDSNHHYFWVPIVGPAVGALMGAMIYDFVIFRGHESWVNRPIYQNMDLLRRKWYKIKRTINKRRAVKYSGDDSDDEYDSDYDAMSATTYGDNSELPSITSGSSKANMLKKSTEPNDEEEPSNDKDSNYAGDTFSLNDIPEEDLDDVELNDMNVYRYERSHLNNPGVHKKKNVRRSDIHFKSSGKNRRFVPTL